MPPEVVSYAPSIAQLGKRDLDPCQVAANFVLMQVNAMSHLSV